MNITDVRIRLLRNKDNRIKAFATIIFDDSFIVRDIRIIEGPNGPFVAMPSKPIKELCPHCSYRNEIKNKFCVNCGSKLKFIPSDDQRLKHRDLAHPITQKMREYIHNKLFDAYKLELNKEKQQSQEQEKEEQTQ